MNSQTTDENVNQLRHFVLAKCYKSNNDLDNFQKEKQQIGKKELIEQLND